MVLFVLIWKFELRKSTEVHICHAADWNQLLNYCLEAISTHCIHPFFQGAAGSFQELHLPVAQLLSIIRRKKRAGHLNIK